MAAIPRRGALLALGLGLLLAAANADAERSFRLPKAAPQYGVQLEDASGLPLATFRHEGRSFVLGEQGERYVVRITNPTSERVEAVLSVDGRDAVSGRVGDYQSQRGYVVPAYGSITVEGFRRDLDAIAAFRFSAPSASYSALRGTPENVGVVGVAFFRERSARSQPMRLVEREYPRSEAAQAPPAAPSRPAAKRGRSAGAPAREAPREDVNNLGTEYGETHRSSVIEVPFERRTASPARIVSLRYDDAEGLRSRGIAIAPPPRAWAQPEPEPFPESRFAPPP